LILRIIVKIDVTKCKILWLKCTKIDFGWGSAPDPARGAYSAPPDSLAGLRVLLLREGEGIWEGRGRGEKGRGRQGREAERGGKGGRGRGRQYFIAPPVPVFYKYA